MSEQDQIKEITEYFESWGLQVKARKKFSEIKKRLSSGTYDYDDEIFQIIDNMIMKDDSQFIKKLPENTCLYRARPIDIKDFEAREKGIAFNLLGDNKINSGYNDVNSREAPIGISGEGRNNIEGVSYLYLADTPETACVEIKSSMDALCLWKIEKRL